ncbi:F0F1 ATP synthase subunit A [Anaerosacchariphilus polymeriproducens]|uniref:ATP synthase subunit a n=1 Tax=Anaerosacchariphilus polymeriproducens TaxID=1812858 RepID=A0A371AZ59_9FIRM|nr:F0F1 ATP synthase subunit A [Anaerosacchariphilus polymeriproducens]RDU24829.1 F0F1 ATP synthase subunit A [Anaerosacchariphilus polymeriproducens]
MKYTEKFTERLLEELNSETVFTIPVFNGISISESVVVTWIIMVMLILISILIVKNLNIQNISKRQIILEEVINRINEFLYGILGDAGKQYIPYLVIILFYLVFANTIGILGFKPPTKDLNVTAALSLMSIILVEYAGIRKKGGKKWIKSFTNPIAIITPFNILEIFIRPLSLCMRLFGNILGSFVVMELIKILIPVVIPVPFSLFFDIFDGVIQAYVFVFLTSLFIKEAIE